MTLILVATLALASAAPRPGSPDAGKLKDGGKGSVTPAAEAQEDADSASTEADGDGPWTLPHGQKTYTAVRTSTPVVLDGKLDDPIWALAPKDSDFLSTRSKPYGQPSPEPTTVQVAYDDEYLYVAFRCGYAKPGAKDDSFAGDETTLFDESESVGVLLDPVHAHTNAYQFAVSPAGVRGDAELSEQGSAQNLDWQGIWEVETRRFAGSWTAEFRIPFGTLRMLARPEKFEIGINFFRREPISGEYSLWALHPPATDLFDTNFFGHLDGLENVHPGERLFLQPYVAVAVDSSPQSNPSRLSNVLDSNPRLYAGAYLRFRPPGPFQLDATVNPDFSAVSPDQAAANYDRFELEYPEVRPFFAEDAPRFQFGAPRYAFGDLGAQLFYSRRLGLVTDTAGLTQIVPILWGVKSAFRQDGVEAALMNVETSPSFGDVSLSDNSTIARITQTIAGQRFGVIALLREGDSGSYLSGGTDADITLFDRHLELSGFLAASELNTQSGLAGEGTVSWKSQDIYAKATYMDIQSSFQAPLGYFPLTGVQAELLSAGYSPVVRNDLVQQVFIDSQLSIVHDRDTGALVYERGVVGLGLSTIQQAVVQAEVMPASENVTTPFPIGNGRVTVAPGTYNVLVTQFGVLTAPGRPVVFGVGYQGGDLYAGTRHAPGLQLGFNLGRLTTKVNYQLIEVNYGTQSFLGHDLLANASFAYTPLIKSTLLIAADTVAARATAQLATTAQFGSLSFLTLVLRETSGSTVNTAAQNWYDNGNFSAILSFTYGASPF